jgi:hypothetical protein
MYAKLFTSIYQGTLRGHSHGLLVFTNLLAHCDKAGIADIHPRAIAEEVGLTVEQVRAALDVLESPDEESRSPEEGGRRIVRIDEHRAWGWRVVNYVKYRAIRNEEDRREQNREAQERYRKRNQPPSAAVSQDKPASAKVSRGKLQSAHTEAEADTEAEALPTPTVPGSLHPSGSENQDPSVSVSPGSAPRTTAKPTAETWKAYSEAYEARYGAPPVRNAKVNGQLAHLVARLGADEAPAVARHYVGSQNGLYVAAMHPTDLLVRDAERLRTEWATGRTVTRTKALLADRTQTNHDAFAGMLAEAKAREGQGG